MIKFLNIPRSIKAITITLLGILLLLVFIKLYLKQNLLLYLRIATYYSKEKIVEKQWKNLDGRWYVRNSDDTTYAAFKVDDKNWQTERYIYIGQVKGGNGPKWFRKHFELDSPATSDSLYLRLSVFDNKARVYINGVFIADSGFIFNNTICYKVDGKILKKGKNVIAVRTLPEIRSSGMVTRLKDEIVMSLNPSISLAGSWKFQKGDNYSYKNVAFDDSNWNSLYVPKAWDSQGLKKYDGMGWYRKQFVLSNINTTEEMVFLGGKIDDYNEVFINGVKLGGNVFKKFNGSDADDWENWVLYRFDGSILRDTNLVSVRVYDATLQGGIYQGPIGIMTLNEFYNFYR